MREEMAEKELARPMRRKLIIVLLLACSLAPISLAKQTKPKSVQREGLQQYIQRMQQQGPDLTPTSAGSLWTDNGKFSNLGADYKAMRVGDVITIVVNQNLAANNAASVAATRTLNASSSITGLLAHASTGAVQNIFSPNSSTALAGKSQGTTTSTLTDSLAGRVVAVLPSGVLVIEAERQMTMNNERQTILVRGLVRPGDVQFGNSVLSNNVGNLELELKGKGVLSDGVRPPNPMVRALLWLFSF